MPPLDVKDLIHHYVPTAYGLSRLPVDPSEGRAGRTPCVGARLSRKSLPSLFGQHSSPQLCRWEQIAGRGRRRQVCEKGTLLISRLDFAVNSISIPVIR